eukprot:2763623-Amphidinium_carterae.1
MAGVPASTGSGWSSAPRFANWSTKRLPLHSHQASLSPVWFWPVRPYSLDNTLMAFKVEATRPQMSPRTSWVVFWELRFSFESHFLSPRGGRPNGPVLN